MRVSNCRDLLDLRDLCFTCVSRFHHHHNTNAISEKLQKLGSKSKKTETETEKKTEKTALRFGNNEYQIQHQLKLQSSFFCKRHTTDGADALIYHEHHYHCHYDDCLPACLEQHKTDERFCNSRFFFSFSFRLDCNQISQKLNESLAIGTWIKTTKTDPAISSCYWDYYEIVAYAIYRPSNWFGFKRKEISMHIRIHTYKMRK